MTIKKRKFKKRVAFLFAVAICVLAVAIIAEALNLQHKSQKSSSASSMASSNNAPSSMASSNDVPSSAASSQIASSIVRSSNTASSTTSLSGQTALGSLLVLVNKTNVLPSGYTPNLVTVPSKYYVTSDKDTHYDARAATYLENFISAGRAAGYNLVIYSGYRTYAYQQNNFNNHVRALEANGETSSQAKIDAAKLVAPPGTSEHETGLAADIVTTDYLKTNSDLNATVFDKTAAFTWLYSNCAKYGFILRYTKDKVDVTKYEYESWHFRFVGVDNAKKIVSSGLCLEEYVAKFNK